MAAPSLDELFATALSGYEENDEASHAVFQLRQLGTKAVLGRASELCRSSDPTERATGADILGQLGGIKRTFPEECFEEIFRMLQTETEPRPRSSAAWAAAHLRDQRLLPLMIDLRSCPDADIRLSVATGLGGCEAAESIEALIELTEDPDDKVRDWATFSLGTQCDADGEDVRNALLRRLNDSYQEAKEEAIAGLCKRQDPRVVPALLEVLDAGPVNVRIAEAAQNLLGIGKQAEDWDSDQYAAAVRTRFSTP